MGSIGKTMVKMGENNGNKNWEYNGQHRENNGEDGGKQRQ